jgi:tetratricopeptide (TPR) repeat protein
MKIFRLIPIVLIFFLSACASQKTGNPGKASATDESGDSFLAIHTDDPEVQRLFERGVVLTYGFNHQEAHNTYMQAAAQDSNCAMCYWGASLVLGPNINKPMDPADAPAAFDLAQKALEHSKEENPLHKSLIQALVLRYDPKAGTDRSTLDQAYADAMRGVAKQFPESATAQVLLAEALMDLHPWDYWEENGTPKEWTQEILETLEAALKLDSNNLNANHLYIHAVEASHHPERAEPNADRLRALAPDSGHLLHMPAHIYLRIGRYADAAAVNEKAIENDEHYRSHAKPEGVYPLAYMPHNRHFLWIASADSGQSQKALKAAFNMAEMVDTQKMRLPGLGTLQHFSVMHLYAMIRFGKWEDILNQPEPAQDLIYPRGIWHYARGRALTRLGKPNEAAGELAKLKTLAADPALKKVTLFEINNTSDLLAVAQHVLAGELGYKRGQVEDAIAHLRQAVAAEDKLNYDEPPAWYYPARQSLGAVLLDAGRASEAEPVFRKDLERHRNNGWSLFGLKQSLTAQGKTDEAKEVKSRFDKTWSEADISLTQARF